MSLKIKYIEFRAKYRFAICWLAFFILFFSGVVYGVAIFYVVGSYFLIGMLEFLCIKCPYCKKMPIKMAYTFPLFPQKCGKCGKSLF
jgi:hypothetical protein